MMLSVSCTDARQAIDEEKAYFHERLNAIDDRISILDDFVWQIARTGGCGCWQIEDPGNGG
jgi:hypothetical protein